MPITGARGKVFKRNTKGKKKKSADNVRKAYRASNYAILINPNISSKGLSNEEKQAIADRLTWFTDKLHDEFNKPNTQLLTGWQKYSDKQPGVRSFEAGEVEVGPTNNIIHTHVVVSFDDFAHLNFNKLREFGKQYISPGTRIDPIRFIDVKNVMIEYARKNL